jgi:hypothetical protein
VARATEVSEGLALISEVVSGLEVDDRDGHGCPQTVTVAHERAILPARMHSFLEEGQETPF